MSDLPDTFSEHESEDGAPRNADALPAPVPVLPRKQAPNKKKQTPTKTPRQPRKSVAELTSATATRAGARPSAASYRPFNPIEGELAPLAPEEVMVESKFKHDRHNTTRRYNSVALHGAVDYHFDAEDFPATPAYKARLESERVDGGDEGIDLPELYEREALLRVTQPPVAIANFRGDLKNPEFLERLRGEIIRPHRVPAQVLHEQAKPAVTEAVAERAASLMNVRELDRFASLPQYNMPEELARAHAQEARTAQEQTIRAVMAQLDSELAALPPDATRSREHLQQERLVLQLDAEWRVPTTAPAVPAPTVGAAAPELTVDEARAMFTMNPLELLPEEMRGNFMSMPEIADLWRMLVPLVYQDESHRLHYNAVELVRAMARRGAKYDGCVRLVCRERLGALLDQRVYATARDTRTGVLMGEHEHFDGEKTTVLVFKFYVVRRSKENIALLNHAIVEQGKANADRTMPDAQARSKAAAQFMNLNQRGLLDLENVRISTESDGTEPEGNLHNIRYLAREFMFCVRVVCVEPAAIDYPPQAPAYPSEDEEPHHFANARAAVFESDDEDAMAEDDARYFVHSDDEDDENEVALARYKRSTHESVPASTIKVSKKVAEACVGKWKAEAFALMCNTHVLNQLCVRSVVFYSDAPNPPGTK